MSSILTSSDLEFMRDSIETLMPDTCDILSVTRTADGQGGYTESWGTAYAGVTCRLDMTTGREQVTGGAVKPYTQYMLSMPYDTVVNTNNRILHNAITYAITSVNVSQSWIAVKRVVLEVL